MNNELSLFVVREAQVSDAEEIARIYVRTWQCAYRGQIPDTILDTLSVEKRTQGWRERLESPEDRVWVYVAELHGRLVGWCSGGKSRDEDATETIGELYGIYIDPEFIGKGAGTALMQKLLDTLRTAGYLQATLWVLASNEKTRWFYERRGWAVEGAAKDEIRDDFVLHEIRYVISLH